MPIIMSMPGFDFFGKGRGGYLKKSMERYKHISGYSDIFLREWNYIVIKVHTLSLFTRFTGPARNDPVLRLKRNQNFVLEINRLILMARL